MLCDNDQCRNLFIQFIYHYVNVFKHLIFKLQLYPGFLSWLRILFDVFRNKFFACLLMSTINKSIIIMNNFNEIISIINF